MQFFVLLSLCAVPCYLFLARSGLLGRVSSKAEALPILKEFAWSLLLRVRVMFVVASFVLFLICTSCFPLFVRVSRKWMPLSAWLVVVTSNFICAFVVDGALCSEVLPSTFAQFSLQVAGSVSAFALKAICLRSCIVRKGVRLGRVCNKFSFHFFAVFPFVRHLFAKLFPLQFCCLCSCSSCFAVSVKICSADGEEPKCDYFSNLVQTTTFDL